MLTRTLEQGVPPEVQVRLRIANTISDAIEIGKLRTLHMDRHLICLDETKVAVVDDGAFGWVRRPEGAKPGRRMIGFG